MSQPEPRWYELGEEASEPFHLTRVNLSADPQTPEVLGQFLLQGLTNTDYLRTIVTKHGYNRVSDYIRERRIPTSLSTRVAGFGEVVSGNLLESEEQLSRPIEKLRYTFNHEWSPHLTDVFAVLITNGEITTFGYCEVKAGTTPPDKTIGEAGYSALLKTWREKTPEILYFTSERLWDAQLDEEYERLDRAMSRPEEGSQLLRLVFVFDEAVWSDSVLETVADAHENNAPPAGAFACYLVTGTDLRSLVERSFDAMQQLAVTP